MYKTQNNIFNSIRIYKKKRKPFEFI